MILFRDTKISYKRLWSEKKKRKEREQKRGLLSEFPFRSYERMCVFFVVVFFHFHLHLTRSFRWGRGLSFNNWRNTKILSLSGVDWVENCLTLELVFPDQNAEILIGIIRKKKTYKGIKYLNGKFFLRKRRSSREENVFNTKIGVVWFTI